MKNSEYLAEPSVVEFVSWLRNLVVGQEPLIHKYYINNCQSWSCTSLWEAHRNYFWNGTDFGQNQCILDSLRNDLRFASENDDQAGFFKSVCRVLEWGGVTNNNFHTLRKLGNSALPILTGAAHQLDPRKANTDRIDSVCYMNSGWTKVYSLLLDNFPIYDGRVGAALGYLVLLYCQRNQVNRVPELLHFRWGRGQGNKCRNPSLGRLQFGSLGYNKWGKREWVRCNLWVAWILETVCNEGEFKDHLPPERRMRALESALFMIGYDLSQTKRGRR